ncbi:hypothetical protein ACJJTC_005342 [Scirpophaga incertulas]
MNKNDMNWLCDEYQGVNQIKKTEYLNTSKVQLNQCRAGKGQSRLLFPIFRRANESGFFHYLWVRASGLCAPCPGVFSPSIASAVLVFRHFDVAHLSPSQMTPLRYPPATLGLFLQACRDQAYRLALFHGRVRGIICVGNGFDCSASTIRSLGRGGAVASCAGGGSGAGCWLLASPSSRCVSSSRGSGRPSGGLGT